MQAFTPIFPAPATNETSEGGFTQAVTEHSLPALDKPVDSGVLFQPVFPENGDAQLSAELVASALTLPISLAAHSRTEMWQQPDSLTPPDASEKPAAEEESTGYETPVTYEQLAKVMGLAILSDDAESDETGEAELVQTTQVDAEADGIIIPAPHPLAGVYVPQPADAKEGVDLSCLAGNSRFRVREASKPAGEKETSVSGQPKPSKSEKRKAKTARSVSIEHLQPDADAQAEAAKENERLNNVYLQSQRGQDYLKQAMATSVKREDGVDHINISTDAQRGLGKALEMNAHTPFVHPELGAFESVGGLWFYVGGEAQDDVFRTLHGYACLHYGRNVRMREVQGFHTIIAEATWIKVISNPRLANAMRDCNVPFESYVYKNGRREGDPRIPAPTTLGQWYVPVMESIRQALRELQRNPDGEVFPDFSFLNTAHRR